MLLRAVFCFGLTLDLTNYQSGEPLRLTSQSLVSSEIIAFDHAHILRFRPGYCDLESFSSQSPSPTAALFFLHFHLGSSCLLLLIQLWNVGPSFSSSDTPPRQRSEEFRVTVRCRGVIIMAIDCLESP